MKILAIVLKVLLAIIITDMIFGAAFYTLTGESVYYTFIEKGGRLGRKFRTQSSIYHHDMRPNVTTKGSWGQEYLVTTNSLAFKDRTQREVSLSSTKHRILFMGDSFAEGIGLSYDETAVGQIDTHYAKEGIETLNAAVATYSPAIYYRKIKHLIEDVGLKFNEVVVFIDISDVENEVKWYYLDEDENVISRHDKMIKYKIFFRKYSILYGIPRFFKLRRKNLEVVEYKGLNKTIDTRGGQWTVSDQAYEEFGKLGVEYNIKHMDMLHAMLKERNIPLTVVVYPWPTQIFHKDLNSRHATTWKTWTDRKQVQFINLFPDFVTDDDKTNTETILRYFFMHDYHWNALGSKKIADAFTDRFQPAIK
jgi:hypothetical protein